MRCRVVALVVAAALCAGCSGQDGPASAAADGPSPRASARTLSATDYVGVWTGPEGELAERGESRGRTFEVASRPMPEHCEWQEATILQVAWPLGSTSAIGDSVEVRGFIRDAKGVLPDRPGTFRGDLDLDADLPNGARPTGYSLGEVEFWLGPDNGEDHAYLVRQGAVERWPREVDPILCG